MNNNLIKSDNRSLSLSKYTLALIAKWEEGSRASGNSHNKISVSQTVSFAAFLYEKMRNAVEFKEDHLIRRCAIERIIKRRMILNENGRDIAEPLIKELLWARYYENNTIGEEKIVEIQTIIDKYFFLRNELSRGRSGREQENLANFMLEVLSCEIEENLSPSQKREAFTNYVYQILRPHIMPFSGNNGLQEKDVQVYIAVEKTLSHSDSAVIRYHLLKLMIPEITQITWKNSDSLLTQLYDIYQHIGKYLRYPQADKLRNIIKKEIPAFLILKDIFEQNPRSISQIITSEEQLKFKVDEACRKRYDESKTRLRRTGIRSFIYILLTKIIFALLLEIPYDLYFLKSISILPISINVIFPPFLMFLIILSVTVPGDDNTRKIYQLILGTIDNNPETPDAIHSQIDIDRRGKARGLLFTSIFSLLYLLTYFISFGSIIYVLSFLKFSVVSQGIFIFFVTLVTFFAFKVIQITQEYQVILHEGFLTPITDFFFLPVIRVGQWLSGEILSKFNVLIFIFDFIIEMPFKAIVEVIDEWVHFVRLKKEEMI
ncbi:hypothetical protein A2960_01975 [Candidatus Gottesmanbacteria bacterium RIFCSPLOWO2_01_FULL_39_12b]|uniref:Uncharacterized protein n=1 Tax=Candidatus Gottesmanbacteria bacterium RIFCSPLOWO2_01_FULL_39_12b TaxID=1798388 RepID=A0A1F6AQC9_9BACT|nr:MAG: hypothetical protein A2960_01975 [Candidatus Gottesmanbacteria bacterium RIFCSPLOWO2_01_FULL_39_12b]